MNSFFRNLIGVFAVLAWILFLPAEDLKFSFEPQAGILKAHFVSRFTVKYPQFIGGFCAYSAGWWEEPIQGMPPGVIACGEYDGTRYGASLLYFQKGRTLRNHWCWVSLSQTDHARHNGLESFVRHFFKDLLESSSKESRIDSLTKKEQWKDNDTYQRGDSSNTLCSWLPSASVALLWQSLHGVKSSRSKN